MDPVLQRFDVCSRRRKVNLISVVSVKSDFLKRIFVKINFERGYFENWFLKKRFLPLTKFNKKNGILAVMGSTQI